MRLLREWLRLFLWIRLTIPTPIVWIISHVVSFPFIVLLISSFIPLFSSWFTEVCRISFSVDLLMYPAFSSWFAHVTRFFQVISSCIPAVLFQVIYSSISPFPVDFLFFSILILLFFLWIGLVYFIVLQKMSKEPLSSILQWIKFLKCNKNVFGG